MRQRNSELREQVTWRIIWLLVLLVVVGVVVEFAPPGGWDTFQPIPAAPTSVK